MKRRYIIYGESFSDFSGFACQFSETVLDNYEFTMPRFRPRLGFSLRTLFVLVTVLACWMGYHANWLRQRKSYLSSGPIAVSYDSESLISLPLGLRILNEQAVRWIVPKTADSAERELAERLFPEAIVVRASDYYELRK